MKYYNKLQNVIWRHLFLLVILMVFLINRTIGANPGSPILTNSSIAYISEETTKQANDVAAYLLQCTEPGASASVSSSITCTHPNVTLTGSSPTTGVTYSWSGPGGFTSGAQSPVIYLPGTYYLTVTSPSGGCTSTASVLVARDTAQPAAYASVSAVINCTRPSVTLQATTNISNATFWWIGPGSYTSSQQNPTVTVSGGYTLVVTNPTNGCASTATTYAEKNTTLPLASAYVSGTLTCIANSVDLTSSSPTTGVSFSWSGPGGFTASTQNTVGSAAGTYTVTVTNPVNTCKSTASVVAVQNIVKPGADITASASVITCTTINSTLYGSSPTVGVTYGWTGPSGYTSDVQNPIAVTAGDYILTTTSAANGCISKDTFTLAVNKVKPGATAVPSGQLNCLNSSITLQGAATSSTVSYKWTGPTAFGSSTLQNPSTTIKGGYILTTTDLINGCQSQAVASVVENKTLPASVTATNNGPLTCSATAVNITGNSSTASVTYSWSGPSYTSSNRISPVGAPGTYTLTVTHPASFCTVVTSTIVSQNSTKPASVAASNDGPLTCSKLSGNLTGSSSTTGVTYNWNGPGFSSTLQNPSVSTPGTYKLTVTDTNNGCKDSSSTIVTQDLTKPAAISATNGGPLTCSLISVSVTGTSSTEGVTYKWSGPSNFTSTAQNPSVNAAGTYKVVITNSLTGCKDSTSTLVAENVDRPGVTATAPDAITCDIRSVFMHANSPTANVVYDWSGPNDYNSTEKDAETNRPGLYTVIAKNPANNCTSSFDILVTHDTIHPQDVTALAPDFITCDHSSVQLQGNSSTTDVNYYWTGPNGFNSFDQNTLANTAGNYVLSVTNFLNGCVTEVGVLVNENKVKPANVNAISSGILNCINNSVTLTGSSSTGGVIYNWVGPGVSTPTATATASLIGTYVLTVTNPSNGCAETKNLTVTRDVTVPLNVSVAADTSTLTCKRTSVTISATSTTNGVEYSWSGPNGFTSNSRTPLVDNPGNYVVTVTYSLSGCAAAPKTINVLQNISQPVGVSAGANGVITCDVPQTSLSGSSTTAGTFSWSGPNGYTSPLPSPIISQGGMYILTVTGTQNGCIAKDTVIVEEDFALPVNVMAVVSGPINCDYTNALLTGSSETDGASFVWNGPGLDNYFGELAFTSFPGVFTLTVTHPTSGCSVQRSVTVLDSTIYPVCSFNVADNSTVEELTTNTISTYYSSKYLYNWDISNPTWEMVSADNTHILSYKAGAANTTANISMLVKDYSTGCESTCDVDLSAVASALKFAPSELGLTPSGSEPDNLVLKVYPVPSKGKVFLRFESPVPTNATVMVYSTNGSLVATLFSGNVDANQNYEVAFNEKVNIPSGVYLCVLKTDEKVVSGKITIE